MITIRTSLLLVFCLTHLSSLAHGVQPLDPWMDDKFGAPIKANASDCPATIYDYSEVAHVNGWDCAADAEREAWIEVARPERVNRDLLKSARQSITIPGRNVDTYQVGDPKKAKFAMIFVHGAGGDKRLAARDTNMGGNFNRLMNLVVRNNGVYYSPTVDFSDGGEGVQTIIEKLQKENPGIKVVIACGSAGAITCHDISNRADSVPHLAGVMFTGAAGGLDDITESAAYKASVPMIIAHGSRDGVDGMLASFKGMRKRPDGTNYPVWMQVFDDGGHGTPIRMIDWKASLNWIFTQNEKKPNCSNPKLSPEVPIGLSDSASIVKPLIGRFNCDQFLNYPFIRQRPDGVSYTTKDKSTCIAPKKEETPGEDLGIITPTEK